MHIYADQCLCDFVCVCVCVQTLSGSTVDCSYCVCMSMSIRCTMCGAHCAHVCVGACVVCVLHHQRTASTLHTHTHKVYWPIFECIRVTPRMAVATHKTLYAKNNTAAQTIRPIRQLWSVAHYTQKTSRGARADFRLAISHTLTHRRENHFGLCVSNFTIDYTISTSLEYVIIAMADALHCVIIAYRPNCTTTFCACNIMCTDPPPDLRHTEWFGWCIIDVRCLGGLLNELKTFSGAQC